MLPFSKPLLLLVTQTHHIHFCYYSPHSQALRVMKVPLFRSLIMIEGQVIEDIPSSVGGRVCSRAAIGFNYNGTVFIVSLRMKS